jgi:hypothetical protein
MINFINQFTKVNSIGIFMGTNMTAGRAAASLALRVLRGVLGSLAKDGMVSLADIDRTIALIERGTVELDRAFAATRQNSVQDAEQSLLAIAKAEIQEESEDGERDSSGAPQNRAGMRSDPIHRLLALPLEPMFYASPPSFSRKFLSAYFATARQLIGPPFISYDSECRAIIQSMLATYGKRLNWEIIYAEPRTISLMRRTFGALIGKLSDGKGMTTWKTLMEQPAADGSMPTGEQIAEVHETILTFFRALPTAA